MIQIEPAVNRYPLSSVNVNQHDLLCPLYLVYYSKYGALEEGLCYVPQTMNLIHPNPGEKRVSYSNPDVEIGLKIRFVK